jgi:mannose-1-phosphate guanylyltransferase/phosphomannomutase
VRTIALLMAGGGGTRMRASGREEPKPLVTAGGATLLERNVFLLLHHGFTDVVVSVPSAPPAIQNFVGEHITPLVVAAGGHVDVLEEARPLGNIGCAAAFAGQDVRLVVVYADNVTTLDLREVVASHARASSAMTLAVHHQPFRLPYGELIVDGGVVTAYVEKPTSTPLICSAVTVIDPPALAALATVTGSPPDAPAGLVDLFRAASGAGLRVGAHQHEAPWADVNDAGEIANAETVLAGDPTTTETWWSEPVQQVACRLDVKEELSDDVVAVDGLTDGCPCRYLVHGRPASPLPAAPGGVAERAVFHLRRRRPAHPLAGS